MASNAGLPSHPSANADKEVDTGYGLPSNIISRIQSKKRQLSPGSRTQSPSPKRPYCSRCDHCRHRELDGYRDSGADDDDDPDEDDDDDSGADEDDPSKDTIAEIVNSWRDSVEPGSPNPGSPARSDQGWDMIERNKIVPLYNFAKKDGIVTPPCVIALIDMSKQPFDPEKEGYRIR